MTSSPVCSSHSLTPDIRKAILLAISELAGNIHPFQDGLLAEPQPCLMAGGEYPTPWTRDASFNSWYAAAMYFPEVARNTLLSVLLREPDGKVRIGGQYWDAIIWAQGAWEFYRHNRDLDFLALAWEATQNSLRYFEETEFDPKDGLFRGGPCFQDGVAGYPDFYTPGPIPFSGIPEWIEHAGTKRYPKGAGVPCKALSTNCLYFRAYELTNQIAAELGRPLDPENARKAGALREAINTAFWNVEKGSYGYLVDAPGIDERQEGLGLAFALLFGVADDRQATRVMETAFLSPHGIPCVWPTYPRYAALGEYGRHSGCVWPHVNAAWALACHAHGRDDLAWKELELLTAEALKDGSFIEVYHPESGLPYGGVQEDANTGKIAPYPVLRQQSWCASGYLAMVLACVQGAAEAIGEAQKSLTASIE